MRCSRGSGTTSTSARHDQSRPAPEVQDQSRPAPEVQDQSRPAPAVHAVSEALRIAAVGPLSGTVSAPPSKSVTNRLLALAALAEGTSRLVGPLVSDDALAMHGLVGALGARVTEGDDGAWVVEGTGGRPRGAAGGVLDCRLSGTTMRFGVALAALADGPSVLDGLPPLRRRPLGPLLGALRELGAVIAAADGRPPVHLAGGGLEGGTVRVDARASSQFASAVLLAAPAARGPVTVHADEAAALDYVLMTVAELRAWGVPVTGLGTASWRVEPARIRARVVQVERDASAAAHLLALGVATGGQVTVRTAPATTGQPDVGIVDVLIAMGATVKRDGETVTARGPARLAPVEVDLSRMPDQVTTVAVLAALADGTSRIRGVAVARQHETDRLAALAGELGALGVRVQEEPDGLVVHGPARPPRRPVTLQTHDDHRLAMAFAALGAALGDVVVDDPACVAKTYPGFWDDAAALGLRAAAASSEPIGPDGFPDSDGRMGAMPATVVTIDGPAGSGKSTVARALARRLGVPHVDTGAYYRALTVAVLRSGVAPGDGHAVLALGRRARIERRQGTTLLDGEDVSSAIRTPAVDRAVSAVSAHPEVRRLLLELQRAGVGAAGGVVEGRDAATVVVPDATLKVWLTADVRERARRRAAERGSGDAQGAGARALEAEAAALGDRDASDAAQMARAEDAVEIDTTGMSVEEVVEAVAARLPAATAVEPS